VSEASVGIPGSARERTEGGQGETERQKTLTRLQQNSQYVQQVVPAGDPRRRRSVLVAGCQTEAGERSPTNTHTRTRNRHEPGDTVDIGDSSITVGDVTLRESVLGSRSPFPVIWNPEGKQFVLFDVGFDNTERESFRFGLRTEKHGDRETYRPRERPEAEDQQLAFQVPTEPVDRAVLVAESEQEGTTVRWRVPERVVEQVEAVPAFGLVEATIGGDGSETAVEVTVENTGERDGILVTTVADGNTADSAVAYTVPVAVRETATERTRIGERRSGQWRITQTDVRRVVYE
jgi:hypothetical protein